MSYKENIEQTLRATGRRGVEHVMAWLDRNRFYEVPASVKFHNNFPGGLAKHSWEVYQEALRQNELLGDQALPADSVALCALLHDVCKTDVYRFSPTTGRPYSNPENYRKGHGLRSVHLLEELGLSLTPDERMAIWWHMGVRNEASKDDYPEENAIAMKDPFCQLIQSADHMAAKSSDKAAEKRRIASLSWDAKRTLFRLENQRTRYDSKNIRIEVYKHNMEIFKAWKYESSGNVIDLIGSRQQLLDATKVYREPVSAAEIPAKYATTRTGCANKDCLVVAKQLIDLGLNPAVLNLADAYQACGMYNSGSSAQEESLCRASTLSLTLYQYYNKTWAKKAGVPLRPVSAYPMDIRFGGIYSPGVTVFRDNLETGFALREEPYQTSVISLAALNFRSDDKTKINNREYRADDGGFTPEGKQIMFDKIRTIYRIALLNGHDSLVLGAFGCGVFQLKPELVAKYFKQILDEVEFRGKFHTIVFAMLEGKATPRKKVEEEGDFAPFYQIFGRF